MITMRFMAGGRNTPSNIDLNYSGYMTIPTAVSKGYLTKTNDSGVYKVSKNCMFLKGLVTGTIGSTTISTAFSNSTFSGDIGHAVSYCIPLRESIYITINTNIDNYILPYSSGSNCILLDYGDKDDTEYYSVISTGDGTVRKIQAKEDICFFTKYIRIDTINDTSNYSSDIRFNHVILRKGKTVTISNPPSVYKFKTFLDDSAIPNFDYTNAYTLTKAKDLGIVSYTVGTKTATEGISGWYDVPYTIKPTQNVLLAFAYKNHTYNGVAGYSIGEGRPSSYFDIKGNQDNYLCPLYLTKNKSYKIYYTVVDSDILYNAILEDTLVFTA